MKEKPDYKNKGNSFTLIELLMVISIITLLSSAILSYIGSARVKSRDAVRLSDMKQIGVAANLYYEDKGEMPISIGVSNGINASKTLVGAGYLSAEPKDPKTKASYNFSVNKINDKNVFTASATYEDVYTTDGSLQQVGVIVGDIDVSRICVIISEYAVVTGEPLDMLYPVCDANGPRDQIIGVTSGQRRVGGSGTVTPPVNNISDCSLGHIGKTCPANVTDGCYCNNGVYSLSTGVVWFLTKNGPINFYGEDGTNGFDIWNSVNEHCSSLNGRLPTETEMEIEINRYFGDYTPYFLGLATFQGYLSSSMNNGIVKYFLYDNYEVNWNFEFLESPTYLGEFYYYCVNNI